MNEFFFFLQIALIGCAVLGAFRLGKEALMVVFCLQALLANLFILKQMRCFGLFVSCTDGYIIGCDFSLGLLQKHYGEHVAKRATYLCLFLMLFFLAMSQLHLFFTPCLFDSYDKVYHELFAMTPRIIIASLFVSFTAQKLNIFIQKILSRSFPQCSLKILLFLPILISQLYDTVSFSLLGLYGIVHSVTNIIVMSFVIKVIAILGMSSFANLSKKISPTLT